MFSRRFRRRSRPSVPTDMQSPRCNRSPLQPATTHRGEPTPSRHNGRNKKGTPRTRQSSLTLAAFPPWGSSQDGRRAKSSPHINPQRHIFPPAKQNLPVRWENSPPYGRNIPIINVVRGLFLSMPMTSGRLAHRSADFRCVPRLEDSTSGLCHTPGTRAGSNTLVGSNPTSSATKPSHPVRTGRLGFSHT